MQTNQQTFTQSQWGNWTPYIMPAAVHRTPGYGYESQLQGHCCSCCMPSFKSLLLDQEIIITNGGDFPCRRLDISHYNQWRWFSLQKVRYILWESLEIGHMTCNCSNPAKKAVVLLCVNIILLCSLKAGLCACRRLRRDLDWPTHQTTAWRVPHGIQTTSDLSPVESRDSSINVYACYSLLEY